MIFVLLIYIFDIENLVLYFFKSVYLYIGTPDFLQTRSVPDRDRTRTEPGTRTEPTTQLMITYSYFVDVLQDVHPIPNLNGFSSQS